MADKITIGIDASSNAIGIGILVDGKFIMKRTIYPSTFDTTLKRVISIQDNFTKEMTTILDSITRNQGTNLEMTVVINKGYVPAVGLSSGANTLKKVEYYIENFLNRRGIAPFSILDSSWMHNVTTNVTRASKKLETVRFVAEKVYPNSDADEVLITHEGKEKYIVIFKKDSSRFTINFTDDEADAIASAYFIENGMVKDQTITSMMERKKLNERTFNLSKLKSIKRTIESKEKKYSEALAREEKYKMHILGGSENKTHHTALDNAKYDVEYNRVLLVDLYEQKKLFESELSK